MDDCARPSSPSGGATVIGRDIIGNVTWTVTGAPCGRHGRRASTPRPMPAGNASIAPTDARNRLATVSYPDGVGNQARLYNAGRAAAPHHDLHNARAGDMVFNAYLWKARRLLVDESITHSGEDVAPADGVRTAMGMPRR
jgi:hypothetical protein